MPQPSKQKPTLLASIEHAIFTIRGERVILDADLARVYGVETKVLNQAVRRNREKFPADFLLELTRPEAVDLQLSRKQEEAILRSQIVTLRHGRHVKHLPFAFTEHGAIMAATVLNSPRAVEVSIYVVRAFVQLRELLAGHKELAKRLNELETRMERKLMTQDQAIAGILNAIRQLMAPPPAQKKRPIGFVTGEK